MSGLEHWDERLIEVDAEAVRYRMAVSSRLRLGRWRVGALEQGVVDAHNEELEALEALEAEAVRQHEQQRHALKYGQYLSVLSAHVEAASGGSLGMVRLSPESEEVRSVLAEVGVPLASPLQILHAYRLHNTRLRDDFNKRLKGDYDSPSQPSSPTRSPGRGGDSSPERLPRPPHGYTHRLLSLRLPPGCVEHTLVHGLRRKPPAARELEWQVNPQTVPEAGCVDMASLASLVRTSAPPPSPLALFSGAAAWQAVLAGEVEEAITARDAERSPEKQKVVREPPARPVAYKPPTVPSTTPPPAGTATAPPELILPLYLLHYGTMTAVPTEGKQAPGGVPAAASCAPVAATSNGTSGGGGGGGGSSATLGEKNVAQTEARASAEPRTASQQRDKAGGASGKGAASSKSSGRQGGGPGSGTGAGGGEQPTALPTALRATREYSAFVAARKRSARCRREAASVFAHSIEGMMAQLTPARSLALVEEACREAELQLLLAEAKAELTKLKKANRDLGSELQTTY